MIFQAEGKNLSWIHDDALFTEPILTKVIFVINCQNVTLLISYPFNDCCPSNFQCFHDSIDYLFHFNHDFLCYFCIFESG